MRPVTVLVKETGLVLVLVTAAATWVAAGRETEMMVTELAISVAGVASDSVGVLEELELEMVETTATGVVALVLAAMLVLVVLVVVT